MVKYTRKIKKTRKKNFINNKYKTKKRGGSNSNNDGGGKRSRKEREKERARKRELDEGGESNEGGQAARRRPDEEGPTLPTQEQAAAREQANAKAARKAEKAARKAEAEAKAKEAEEAAEEARRAAEEAREQNSSASESESESESKLKAAEKLRLLISKLPPKNTTPRSEGTTPRLPVVPEGRAIMNLGSISSIKASQLLSGESLSRKLSVQGRSGARVVPPELIVTSNRNKFVIKCKDSDKKNFRKVGQLSGSSNTGGGRKETMSAITGGMTKKLTSIVQNYNKFSSEAGAEVVNNFMVNPLDDGQGALAKANSDSYGIRAATAVISNELCKVLKLSYEKLEVNNIARPGMVKKFEEKLSISQPIRGVTYKSTNHGVESSNGWYDTYDDDIFKCHPLIAASTKIFDKEADSLLLFSPTGIMVQQLDDLGHHIAFYGVHSSCIQCLSFVLAAIRFVESAYHVKTDVNDMEIITFLESLNINVQASASSNRKANNQASGNRNANVQASASGNRVPVLDMSPIFIPPICHLLSLYHDESVDDIPLYVIHELLLALGFNVLFIDSGSRLSTPIARHVFVIDGIQFEASQSSFLDIEFAKLLLSKCFIRGTEPIKAMEFIYNKVYINSDFSISSINGSNPIRNQSREVSLKQKFADVAIRGATISICVMSPDSDKTAQALSFFLDTATVTSHNWQTTGGLSAATSALLQAASANRALDQYQNVRNKSPAIRAVMATTVESTEISVADTEALVSGRAPTPSGKPLFYASATVLSSYIDEDGIIRCTFTSYPKQWQHNLDRYENTIKVKLRTTSFLEKIPPRGISQCGPLEACKMRGKRFEVMEGRCKFEWYPQIEAVFELPDIEEDIKVTTNHSSGYLLLNALLPTYGKEKFIQLAKFFSNIDESINISTLFEISDKPVIRYIEQLQTFFTHVSYTSPKTDYMSHQVNELNTNTLLMNLPRLFEIEPYAKLAVVLVSQKCFGKNIELLVEKCKKSFEKADKKGQATAAKEPAAKAPAAKAAPRRKLTNAEIEAAKAELEAVIASGPIKGPQKKR